MFIGGDKVKILCFAENHQEVARELKKQSEYLYEHLIKVWMFPYVPTQNHWKQEIGTKFMVKVDKLRHTKKYPSSKFILNHTWYKWEDALLDRIPTVLARIDEKPLDVDYHNIYDAIHDYMVWAANILSKRGALNPRECYSKVEELREMYF